ncbi:MAG: restriction endonuclease subunit S, partial [Proteobacteria bacterium]|nr:restriction endonuclease subunit S [Pseudomonadota bacterium]
MTMPIVELAEQDDLVSKLDFVDSLINARREQLAKLDELVKSRFIELFGEPLMLLESGKTISLEKVFSEITVGFVGEAASSYVKVGIPYLRTQNVRKGYIDFSGLIYVSEEFHGANRKSQIKPGDIVVSRVGVNRGMAAVIPQTLEEANIANCLIIKKEKTVNSEYLAYYLNMSYGLSPKFGASVGSAQGVINTAILKKWEVFLPPYSQQNQFAAFVKQTDKSKFAALRCLNHNLSCKSQYQN